MEIVRVEDEARLKFLPNLVGGKNLLMFENTVYAIASRMSRDYSGGLWDFYIVNGSGFMAPRDPPSFDVVVRTNDYEGEMSAIAFGIVCTLFALNRLAWTGDEAAGAKYYALLAYATEHPEANAILGAID